MKKKKLPTLIAHGVPFALVGVSIISISGNIVLSLLTEGLSMLLFYKILSLSWMFVAILLWWGWRVENKTLREDLEFIKEELNEADKVGMLTPQGFIGMGGAKGPGPDEALIRAALNKDKDKPLN